MYVSKIMHVPRAYYRDALMNVMGFVERVLDRICSTMIELFCEIFVCLLAAIGS